ncbi:MAG TPA: primosomal protein N' [Candidatus Saccharimonadia bacterium]|jgi:primosomal protein N' (replication factor Y)
MDTPNFYLITPLAYTGSTTAFTYHFETMLEPGSIVEVPVGRRQLVGVILECVTKPDFATKPITRVLELPPIPADLRDLATWMSGYYAASPGMVWSTMLPAGLTRTRRATATPATKSAAGLPPLTLTTEQSNALRTIRGSSKSSFLLQGITGSGKTRVYLELTAEALAAGRSVIVLVPEITLTPQTVDQFQASFGDQVLASHSKLTEAKRHQIWLAALGATAAGQPRVIIGPRSCLFMPLHNLGLIVIDESHESTYKQEQHPRYQAATVAAKRARYTGARIILGSATPGLQELFLAQEGLIEHIKLTQRANDIPLSQARILDLRDKQLFRLSKFITQPLVDAIAATLAQNRQSLLYVNRRGSASSQVCGDCGHVIICPHCRLPLTFHADLMRLICHHCNFRRPSPAVCPECNGANLKLLGGGTKRIEAEAERLFSGARIARLDRDSATLSHIQTVYKQLRAGELDIVVGTQMIAKGLDLPAIDTVGVVSADTMLNLPDFTAAERTFQLLSQVSGRAGRGDRPGQIYIQTYSPSHPAIVSAATGSYDAFATAELAERKALSYPPYVYLLKLDLAAPSRERALAGATQLAVSLRSRPGLAVIGPAPAFIELQSGKFHWTITIKSKQRSPLVDIAAHLPSSDWSADLDPANLL